MRPKLVLFLMVAGCSVAPQEAAGPGPDEQGSDEAALGVVAASGRGPWVQGKANTSALASIDAAETLLNTHTFASLLGERSFALPELINATEGSLVALGKPGDYNAAPLAGLPLADNYVLSFSGYLKIPAAAAPNDQSFVVGSDDGYRLRIHNGTTTSQTQFPGQRSFAYGTEAGANTATSIRFPPEGGMFPFELTFFDGAGSSGVELLSRLGQDTSYGGSAVWGLVPKASMYAPDLHVTMTVQNESGGVVAVGSTLRWTIVLRNLGLTPVYPASGNSWPNGGSGTGVMVSNCISPGLAFGSLANLPAGTPTPQVVDCGLGAKRFYVFMPAALQPGEIRSFDYTTTVTGTGVICDGAFAYGSTTDIPGVGQNRVFRTTNDPTADDMFDVMNAPIAEFPAGAADDDDTCLAVGSLLPVFAVTAPAQASTVVVRRPALQGTARTAALVVVSLAGPGGATGTCQGSADAQGAWQCTFPSDLVDGSWTATVRTRDASGDESQVLTRTFTVLATALAKPTLAAVTSPTADATPTFTGTAPAGTTVTVVNSAGGATLCTATTAANGTYSCAPSTPLAAGTLTVRARASDGVRPAVDSDPVTFVLDTASPAMPQLNTPGAVVSTRTPTLSGTAEEGTTVNVRRRADDGSLGAPLCTATTTGGAFSCLPAPPLADGPYLLEADATDDVGNVSAKCGSGATCANQASFVVDLGAPSPPVFDPVASPTRAVPPLAGAAEAGARVKVREGGALFCDVLAAAGRFTCPAHPFADGPHTVAGTATDAAGNTSPDRTLTFVVDTTPPARPVLTPVASPAAARLPVLSGRAEAGTTVRVLSGTTTLCTATATAAGTWTCTPAGALADGTYSFTAVARDPAGNDSPPSAAVSYVLDATAPAAPTLAPLESPTSDTLPTFTGTAEKGSTVRVLRGSEVLCSAIASDAGAFSCQPATALADGAYDLKATATDATGNASAPSADLAFVVDATPPPAPALDDLPSSSGNDPRPTFTGRAQAGTQVRVREAQAVVCRTTATDAGHFSCSTADFGLADGLHHFDATSTDAARNDSDRSNLITYDLDTVAPDAPRLAPAPAVTAQPQPLFLGTAEPASAVTVSEGATTLCATGASAAGGHFECRPATLLSDGAHVVTAVATDAAGNASKPSEGVTWLVDSTVPDPPVITSPLEGTEIEDVLEVSGTAHHASKVELSVDDAAVASAPVLGGTWTVRLEGAARPPLGAHTMLARATDAAGNKGLKSGPVTVVVVGVVQVEGGRGTGCTSAGASSLGLLAFAALLARRRGPALLR